MRYLCWGDGYGREDGRYVTAPTPQWAAQRYAELRDDGKPWCDIPTERVIFVQAEGAGPGAFPLAFEVAWHLVAEYEARQRKGGA